MGVGDTGTLHHSCWIVEDVEKAARRLAESLAVEWALWTIEPLAGTVHGEEASYSFRVAIAQVGDCRMELIEPLAGRSVYTEQLESRGEGFHHTCIIYPSRQAMRRARDELAAQGREMTQTGDLGELGEFCYFHMAEIDSALELLYLSELPEPEQVIGA